MSGIFCSQAPPLNYINLATNNLSLLAIFVWKSKILFSILGELIVVTGLSTNTDSCYLISAFANAPLWMNDFSVAKGNFLNSTLSN